MYTRKDAQELRCPFVDKKCITIGCMSWEWISQLGDIRYENSSLLSDENRSKLLLDGYRELPAHGFGLTFKKFFPMTEEEIKKMSVNNTFGTQLFFGKDTNDITKWIGQCKAINPASAG